MAQVAFSIRMDEDLKRDFGRFCNEIGMSMTTAFVIFARKTLNERRIPFILDLPPERFDDNERIRLRAKKAVERIRDNVKARGLPDLTMEEIDAEIAASRRERKSKDKAASV